MRAHVAVARGDVGRVFRGVARIVVLRRERRGERRGDGARFRGFTKFPSRDSERRRNLRDDVFVEDVDEDVDAVVAAALGRERRAVHVRAESSLARNRRLPGVLRGVPSRAFFL